MDNGIQKRQNQNENLKIIAAQRNLYDLVKYLTIWHFFLCVVFPILLPFISYFFSDKVKQNTFVLLISLILPLVDLFMKDIIKKKQNSAAKKQELFDVKVLKMKWNQTIYGEKSINQHDVSKQAKKYLKKNRTFSGLKDWYPLEYSKIKLYAGRLMCQKVNVDWDKELRRKYHIFLCVSFAATILVLLCYILLNEEYYSNVMIKLSPIIPIGVYYIKKINSNIKLMTSYEKAETQAQLYMDELFKDEGNERIFERKSRELQDSIFKTRKETILIWNWFYKLFRNNDEQNMIDTSKELVKEYCNYNHKDG